MAVLLSVALALLALASVLAGVVRTFRDHSQPAWTVSFVPSLRRDPTILPIAVMVATIALPWVRGSAVGVTLPSTLLGLPWLGVIVTASIGLAAVLLLATHLRRSPMLRCTLQLWLFALTTAGGVVLVATAVAQRVSHYTFLSDTVLRGVGRAHDVLPVVRVGVGEILFVVGAAVACAAATTRTGRVEQDGQVSRPAVPPSVSSDPTADTGSDPLDDRFEVPWT